MLEVCAYAKINLFLDIENKRQDGYHNIVSVMQTVDWCDRIFIEKSTDSKISLLCTDAGIPTDESNTVHKATSLFLERISCKEGLKITIEKHLPHAAGLAGGSADAAATLKGLNQMFGNPLSQSELILLGTKIGADVPFCLVGGTKLTKGIGERLEAFPPMPPCFLVCAKSGEGISTPNAYRALDRKYADFNGYLPKLDMLQNLKKALEQQTLDVLPSCVYNIFEPIAEEHHPSVTHLKQTMLAAGAILAMMSGSGPSVFGVFRNRHDAERACDTLQGQGAICEVCSPIQEG